jgi:hypothetical protein
MGREVPRMGSELLKSRYRVVGVGDDVGDEHMSESWRIRENLTKEKKNGGVPAVDRRPSVYDLHPT